MPIPEKNPLPAEHPLRKVWSGMLQRCTNKKSVGYKRYGGTGIKVCKRWRKSFRTFVIDVGPRPSPKHSLDRFPNPHGNYELNNVRWATATEQARNRRDNKLTIGLVQEIKAAAEQRTTRGETYKSIADQFGISEAMVAKIMLNQVWKDNDMSKKRRKEPEKKPVGRPKTLPADLDTRFQIRCAKADEKAWKARATQLGYSAGQWIRKVLNDALAQPVK